MLLNGVIEIALEAPELGYRVKRADEDAEPGMINDRVIRDIVSAQLVVADLTFLNPNALDELGIRHAAKLPAIHMAAAGTDLPFDSAGHGTIFVDLANWDDIVSASDHLAAAAQVTKDPIFRVSNPLTQANATYQMQKSSDPRDEALANLIERIAEIERSVQAIKKNGLSSRERAMEPESLLLRAAEAMALN